MEHKSRGQVAHLYIHPLISPIAVGTARGLRDVGAMARQELSQTNVFHQTALCAALHKGIAGGMNAERGAKLEAPRKPISARRPPFLCQKH